MKVSISIQNFLFLFLGVFFTVLPVIFRIWMNNNDMHLVSNSSAPQAVSFPWTFGKRAKQHKPIKSMSGINEKVTAILFLLKSQ